MEHLFVIYFFQLVFEMEGFDIKIEGMFGGQVIPLLSVDGSIQGEVKNWSSAVSQSRESFVRDVSCNISKTSASVSSGVPNTEKVMKA